MTSHQLRLNTLIYKPSGSEESLASELQNITAFEFVHATYSMTQVFHALAVMKVDVVLLNRHINPNDLVILRNSYPQVAVLVYCKENEEVSAELMDLIVDILVLPIRTSQLPITISRIIRFLEEVNTIDKDITSHNECRLQVREGQSVHFLSSQDVIYIESMGEYVRYHTPQKKYMALGSLKKLREELPKGYLQIHRSFIINTSYITSISSTQVVLIGGIEIPVGRTFKDSLRSMIL